MKKLLLSLLILTGLSGFAQRTCGTSELVAQELANNPALAAFYQEAKAYYRNPTTTQNRLNNTTAPTVVITIPVVFHVLYKTAQQNISDSQINSQLAVLNADFRKLNLDFAAVVPDEFEAVAADAEILFCKATIDPNGAPTTGITRKSVPSSFNFTETTYYTAAGQPSWDTTQYLNIWIGKFANTQLLGFAWPPQLAGQPKDGVCISFDCLGTNGQAQAPFNKGRTATHEVGHYLGLDHIWDAGCVNNDGVEDTPPTTGPYFGCPEYPATDGSCDGSVSMTMNYMDYTDDACMAMFTEGQKVVMHNVLDSARVSLLTSNGCGALSVDETQAISAIAVYPNPVSQYFMITSPHTSVDMVEIFNTNGQLVKTQKLTDINNKIYIEELESGVYYLRIYNEGKFLKSDKMIKK